MKNNYYNKIFNYQPGARGDFLLSSLLETELNLTATHRNELSKSCYKIKGAEKFDFSISRDSTRDTFSKFFDYLSKTDFYFPQSCHYVSLLDASQLEILNEKFDIYQITVDPRYHRLISFFSHIKNNLAKVQTTEELDVFLDKFDGKINAFTRWAEWYHQSSADKPCTRLSFEKLFYPPYDDYINLYVRLNGMMPDISVYKQRLLQAELPKTMTVLDTVLEIDVDNLTVKKL